MDAIRCKAGNRNIVDAVAVEIGNQQCGRRFGVKDLRPGRIFALSAAEYKKFATGHIGDEDAISVERYRRRTHRNGDGSKQRKSPVPVACEDLGRAPCASENKIGLAVIIDIAGSNHERDRYSAAGQPAGGAGTRDRLSLGIA